MWLGVDAVRLSPIFPSPLAGFGYDPDIDPIFGTLAGFEGLLVELRGDKGVILRGSASRYWTMIAGPLAIS